MIKHGTIFSMIVRAKPKQNLCFSNSQRVRSTATLSAEKETYFDDATLAAAKPFESIPTFLALPWIGTGWTYLPVIGHFDLRYQHLALIKKRRMLGDIFREQAGKMNVVFTFSADDTQTIFKNEGPYPFRYAFESIKAYRELRKEWYKTAGLIVMQGKEWHDLRTKTQKHLMKPKAIQAYLNPMQDVARDLANKIFHCRDSNKEVPDFLGELYNWALESVAVVGLDTRLGCLRTELSPDSDGIKMITSVQTQLELIYKLEPLAGNLPFWKYFDTPSWKKFKAAADIFTEISFKYINRAVEEIKTRTDNDDKDLTLLQCLLMTKGLNVSGAMVTVSDMLMAGIDTTSHSVAFFLYHMTRNPEKQEILYKEIKNLLPHKEDRINPNVYNDLKYMKACMKESQRLDPVVAGTGRTLDHDIIASGYRIPAGTFVIACLQTMYRDEKYFQNPNQFIPERWLNKEKKCHPFAYLPFGVGTRSCIGRRLAELEIICLLTELIRNFRIEYHYEDIGMYTRLVNTPEKPLRYNFIER